MRGFGICLLIAGVVGLIGAMSMDVSVASGFGRVNNLGLMSERQNFTIVAGIVILAGLLMLIFGGKSQSRTVDTEGHDASRPCPFCAEPIKRAAVKCKHCGSDVEPLAAPALGEGQSSSTKGGWTVRYYCGSDSEMGAIKTRIAEMPASILKTDGMTVVAGFFQEKDDAKEFRNRYSMKHGANGELHFESAWH